jgi:ABC-type lipoprotein export system ATPase subunit
MEVAKGEAVAVIGPSGCGKTTLLLLAGGVESPDSGDVLIDGQVLSKANDAQRRDLRLRRIGFVFQDFRLLEYLDVLQNILLPYRLGALEVDADVIARAKALAKDLGINELLRRRIDRLSHGERQRVAICRALVTNPACVLADEPTGNLDPLNKHAILDALLKACRKNNAAMLVVTHDHDLLESFDRVIDLGSLEATS